MKKWPKCLACGLVVFSVFASCAYWLPVWPFRAVVRGEGNSLLYYAELQTPLFLGYVSSEMGIRGANHILFKGHLFTGRAVYFDPSLSLAYTADACRRISVDYPDYLDNYGIRLAPSPAAQIFEGEKMLEADQ